MNWISKTLRPLGVRWHSCSETQRLWINFGESWGLNFELARPEKFPNMGARITFGAGEDALAGNFKLPWLGGLYWSLENWPLQKRVLRLMRGPREFGIQVFEEYVWVKVGFLDNGHYGPTKWRFGPLSYTAGRYLSLNWQELLWGKFRVKITKHPVEMRLFLMPEGPYDVIVTREEREETWDRWPGMARSFSFWFDFPTGVPGPDRDKDWCSGDDATFGIGSGAATLEEACQDVVAKIQRERRRYAGPNWVPEGGWSAKLSKAVL